MLYLFLQDHGSESVEVSQFCSLLQFRLSFHERKLCNLLGEVHLFDLLP